MSNVYTLDALKADLDREFAPLKLDLGGEQIVLRNLMRVGKTDREAVLTALKVVEESNLSEEDAKIEDLGELGEQIELILKTVVADGKGEKLVTSIGGDIALSTKLIELWVEATQPGEAQNSPA
ncbi:phage tail assembly protein [Amycolatopsis sp.]|uniref:phage tail assembly protein n=1 Tax=Amycolatopsis sp. TaxID=37632 RepID=UPI002B53802E|nr:phage tail assembly protein [Amycolatopsis sp.]HVV11576.1 phage tail assembly protein [Amycolatopsis sp.]